MKTVFQVKESIHRYLQDEYCMDNSQIGDFLHALSDELLQAARAETFPIRAIVEPMINWGNRKVERVISEAYYAQDNAVGEAKK